MPPIGNKNYIELWGDEAVQNCTHCKALLSFGLVVQNRVQQGTVDFDLLSVVIDQAHFPKFVHEKAHARPGRADHLGKNLLIYVPRDWLRPTFLAKMR
jgi:hypothetical protein